MRGDVHVRFGGRVAETHRPKDRQGAAARPLLTDPHRPGVAVAGQRAGCVLPPGDRLPRSTPRRRRRWSPTRSAWRSRPTPHRPGRSSTPTRAREFASWAFTQRAKDSGLVPSMGSVGDCSDNPGDRGVLVAHADRAAGPSPLAHQGRAGRRDLPGTWRSSTTTSAAIAALACSPRYSSRTHPPWHEESTYAAPRNPRQTIPTAPLLRMLDR